MNISTAKKYCGGKKVKRREEFIGLISYSEVPDSKKGWYIFAAAMAILGSLSMTLLLVVAASAYNNNVIAILGYSFPLICVLGMSLGIRKSCYKPVDYHK